MSYQIFQTSAARKLAVSLQRKCDVDAIRLIEISAHSTLVFNPDLYPLAFSVDFRPDSIVLEERMLRANTLYMLRIIDREKNDIVTIKCVIAGDYRLEDGYIPSEEQTRAFQEGPAIHNCWPYFRECVQAVISRMNYPPLTIPFLWVGPARPEQRKAPKQISAPKPEKAPRQKVQAEPARKLKRD